jgi:hypothetical protein
MSRLALRIISQQRSISVAFGANRTVRQISRRGLKPTDGAVGHVVGSGDVDQGFASFAPCHGFLALALVLASCPSPRRAPSRAQHDN